MPEKPSYVPPKKILEKYAGLIVNFALGGGKGIKKGDVVHIVMEECAKPLFMELRKAIWRSGGHVIADYQPSVDVEHNPAADFYKIAREHQIKFFPEAYIRGFIKQIDHSIWIDSETDKHSLAGIDPKKIMRRGEAMKKLREWRDEKENQGKLTWTISLYGTEAMAKEAGLSLKEYWWQIVKACYLDAKDPIVKWRLIFRKLENYRRKLNNLDIDRLHVKGPDVDLWITMGEKRRWAGGSGRNMPSFELFTSPDCRGTEGWIRFNQPLYRYGNLINGIQLWFENGKVVKSKATKNEKVLKQMIKTKGADMVGEFSLTDKRFSRITRFMAETLFDENMGGPNGNTHIALGKSYHDCYEGDPTKVSKKQWQKLGFNTSSVHTDMISTTPRIVTAYLKNGKSKVIYKKGQFMLD